MFGIKCLFTISVIFTVEQTPYLESSPAGVQTNIVKAESVIRATANTLFYILGLRKVQKIPKLHQYAVVHNYFVSLTLKDYSNVKLVKKLSRLDKSNKGNVTTDFIALIDEILNEDNVIKLQNIVMGEVSGKGYDVRGEMEKLELLKKFHDHQYNKSMIINYDVLRLLQESLEQSNDTIAEEKDHNDHIPSWKDVAFPIERRLYKGKRTKIKKFPFMASVEIFGKFQCGSSIIKSDLVITAASCLQLAWNNRFYRENPAFLSVRVGSSFYEFGGENIPVIEIYFHPNYNPKTLRNNIAMMRLLRKIKLRKNRVQKIEIGGKVHKNSGRIVAVGWGAYTTGNMLHNPWEDKIRYATLNIYPIEDCQDVYSSKYVTERNFCAGFISDGTGACNRDVGGPGIMSDKLVGIISFGAPMCGKSDTPTVFTKLSFYQDWIEEIMDQKVPWVKRKATSKLPTYPYKLPRTKSSDSKYMLNPSRVSPISSLKPGTLNKPTTGNPIVSTTKENLPNKYLKSPYKSHKWQDDSKSILDELQNIREPLVSEDLIKVTAMIEYNSNEEREEISIHGRNNDIQVKDDNMLTYTHMFRNNENLIDFKDEKQNYAVHNSAQLNYETTYDQYAASVDKKQEPMYPESLIKTTKSETHDFKLRNGMSEFKQPLFPEVFFEAQTTRIAWKNKLKPPYPDILIQPQKASNTSYQQKTTKFRNKYKPLYPELLIEAQEQAERIKQKQITESQGDTFSKFLAHPLSLKENLSDFETYLNNQQPHANKNKSLEKDQPAITTNTSEISKSLFYEQPNVKEFPNQLQVQQKFAAPVNIESKPARDQKIIYQSQAEIKLTFDKQKKDSKAMMYHNSSTDDQETENSKYTQQREMLKPTTKVSLNDPKFYPTIKEHPRQIQSKHILQHLATKQNKDFELVNKKYSTEDKKLNKSFKQSIINDELAQPAFPIFLNKVKDVKSYLNNKLDKTVLSMLYSYYNDTGNSPIQLDKIDRNTTITLIDYRDESYDEKIQNDKNSTINEQNDNESFNNIKMRANGTKNSGLDRLSRYGRANINKIKIKE